MNELRQLTAKKSLGQHFLTSPVVPNWMCDAAHLTPGELVLEIGPGTGVLTKAILERGARVIALEADERAVDILQATFSVEIAAQKLTLIHADIRTLDLGTVTGLSDHNFKVVANIPYYLSGFLFRSFLETPLRPSTMVYLVQKEVAKRATSSLARGEKESLLSLSIKAYGEPQYIRTVSRGHFTPTPKVDSGIIAISCISRDRFKHCSEATFFTLLKLGFGQKRKQLLGNLALAYSREVLEHTFTALGLSLSIRAEDIDISTWMTLTETLGEPTTPLTIHR